MKGNKIFKAAFLVMIISVLSRFLGLFRDMLVGYQFGVSIYTDAYKAAVSVPETIFTIVGLAISTVFIPMLSKVKYDKNKDEMFKFSNNIISILLVISIIIFALGFIFTNEIVSFMFDGFSKEKFIVKYMDKLPCKIYMGVGGSFDVIAEKVNRAPRWMINIGMEWAYRVAKEPWRIKRLGSIPKFIWTVAKSRGNK